MDLQDLQHALEALKTACDMQQWEQFLWNWDKFSKGLNLALQNQVSKPNRAFWLKFHEDYQNLYEALNDWKNSLQISHNKQKRHLKQLHTYL